MPAELWTKLIADAPILAVLIIVLWKGGEKLDKLTLAVKTLSGKVELIGRIQDMRFDLHEERTSATGKYAAIAPNGAGRTQTNGTPPAQQRVAHPSWPEPPSTDEDEE